MVAPFNMEHEGLKGILESRRAPGLTNMNKGPGCAVSSYEIRPEAYDLKREVRKVAQQFEADGKMKENPGWNKFFADKIKSIDSRPDSVTKRDLQVQGTVGND